jgi:ElaB/YqjD/DUF883 family membrane-anchored ribosome-binding protein
MAEGLLQRLPKIEPLLQQQATAQGQLKTLRDTFESLEPDNQNSPLHHMGSLLVELEAKLDIDVSGLRERFPRTIEVIENSVPPAAVEYVEAIEDAYSAARSFLQDNPLAREVAAGRTLQEVALAVIEEALAHFHERIEELTRGLVDPDTLEQITSTLEAIERFSSDFPSHRDEFLEFFPYHLLGVRPDLLREPLRHLEESYAVLAPLAEEALEETVNPAQEDLAAAFDELVVALEGFDPEDVEAYAELELRLDGLEPTIRSMVGTVTTVYRHLQTLVETHAWDDIFSEYRNLLQAVTIDRPFTLDVVTNQMAEVLEELLARLQATFADDLAQRIETLNSIVHDTFATSALGQLRQTVRDFLEEIRTSVESVPTEEIQRTVETMLEQVGQELEALGITEIKEGISDALDEAQRFVEENIDDELTDAVKGALDLVLSSVRSLGLDAMISELTAAVDQLGGLVSELEEALTKPGDDDQQPGLLTQLEDILSQLDTLSFKPVSAEVIEEIDELRARLEAIDPSALSDAERFALRVALAFLEDIDLEGWLESQIKRGYDVAEGQVKRGLDEITIALEQLRKAFEAFRPGQVLGPVNEGLEQASSAVRKVNGKALVQPLKEEVNRLEKELGNLSPGQLLDGLQGPYDSMMQAVNRLDPARWLAPLNELYEQIERLIDVVDVTPLLDELDSMQRQLFGDIREAIVGALDALELPELLQGMLDGIRPMLQEIADDLFADPGSELRRIGIEVNTQLSLDPLAEPLDEAFDELIRMVESIPEADLTNAVNVVRATMGAGLDALDPTQVIRTFRRGQARLAELDPRILLQRPLTLPALKLAFEVEAEAAPPERQADVVEVSARFDAVISLTATDIDSNLIQPLIEAHDALTEVLHRRINALDASGATEAYADLRDSLGRLVPPFLRSPTPLTHDEIMDGLRAMRPSVRFERVEEVLERFLQQLRPLGDALEPATNRLFEGIREVLMLVNPLDLKDAVEDIYDAVRAKVRTLDPEALSDSIRDNVFGPVTGALEDINPAAIKSEIDGAYQATLAILSERVEKILDDIADALDADLAPIRGKLQELLKKVEETLDAAAQSAEEVAARLEGLIFKELLERLRRVIDNLGMSFDRELDRVRNAFDEMLAALPVGSAGGTA